MDHDDFHIDRRRRRLEICDPMVIPGLSGTHVGSLLKAGFEDEGKGSDDLEDLTLAGLSMEPPGPEEPAHKKAKTAHPNPGTASTLSHRRSRTIIFTFLIT
jgi:hypothetical protein